jgi:hypothetical protein
MAGVNFAVTTEVLTGTDTVTLLQLISAADRRCRIDRIIVSGKGVLNTDIPVTVEVVEQSTAGTIASNPTVYKTNAADPETLGVTAAAGFSSTEPTFVAMKESENIHPQGSKTWVFPRGQKDLFVGGHTAGRLGIRAVSPGQATKLRVTIEGEE